VSVVVSESLQPVLQATATVPGTGSQSLKFFARKVGSSTWDLLNGTSVSGTTGTAQVPAGQLGAQQQFEYRAEHCDATGCTPSATQTGQVAPDVGIGARPGVTGIPFTVGDAIGARATCW
jgi:hypothetical protein